MFYVTGDTHGNYDIYKLSTPSLNKNNISLTSNDYLIICGDFGLVWNNSPNANTYLTRDVDGDIFIENLSDADETMTIHRENLPGLIAALQEIQGLYEKCRGIK